MMKTTMEIRKLRGPRLPRKYATCGWCKTEIEFRHVASPALVCPSCGARVPADEKHLRPKPSLFRRFLWWLGL